MPVGLEVTTDTGFVQVGTERPLFSRVMSGTVTFNTNLPKPPAGGIVVRCASVVVTNAVSPLIAIRSEHENGASLYYVTKSGSTWTFWLAGVSGTTCEFWVFDRGSNIPPENYGLETFDASGNSLYHTGRGIMNVVGFPDFSGFGAVFSYPAGRKYATVEFGMGGGKLVNNIFQGIYTGYAWYSKRWDANVLYKSSVSWTSSQIANGNWPFHSADNTVYALGQHVDSMVVDVTGL